MKFKALSYKIIGYKGYRTKIDISNVNYFKNIKYKGFSIIRTTSDFIIYELETQIIRKLKIRKVNNLTTNIEDRFLKLLKQSFEYEDEMIQFFYKSKNPIRSSSIASYSYRYPYTYSGMGYPNDYICNINLENNKEIDINKNNLMLNQERLYKHKLIKIWKQNLEYIMMIHKMMLLKKYQRI